MDSTKVFCPNETCPARGRIGEGNITVHDKKNKPLPTITRRRFHIDLGAGVLPIVESAFLFPL